jgi:hypothetical protein
MRLLARSIAIAMAVLSMLVVAQTAQAADPTVLAAASLTNVGDRNSDGRDDTARAGELVNATASVQNLLDRRQVVRVTVGLTPPGGDTVELRYPILIGAIRTARVSLTFPILRFVPPGAYTLSVSATDDAGATSTAEDTLEILP